MNRQYSRTECIFLAILTITVYNIMAATNEPIYILRSSDVLKFDTQKAETVEYTGRTDSLQLFTNIKPEKENNFVEGGELVKSSMSSKPTSFSVFSEFITAQNAYKITLTDFSGGGVLLSAIALDQAPAKGYAPSTECFLPLETKAYEIKKYVYLKTKASDKPLYQYSRLELDMTIGKAKLIIDMNAVTNPDGSTNLKEDKEARQQYITNQLNEIKKAIEDKTATDEQIEEMHKLVMLEQQDRQNETNRWDFEGNQTRIMKQKRERLLEADGRLRTKQAL